MIVDAFSTAVLISMLTVILSLGDLILQEVGVDWPSFYAWLSGLTGGIVAAMAGLSYISSAVKMTSYSFVSGPLSMAASYLATAFSSIKAIYLLSSFIYVYRDKLATLGILLYSLPFRMGKGVGSFLIAASVVMYAGFPLMPAFVSTFQGVASSLSTNFSEPVVTVRIVDLCGKAVPYPVVRLFSDKQMNEEVGVLIGGPEGKVIIGGSKDLLPKNYTLYVGVGYSGYLFYPEPRAITSGKTLFTLKVSSLLTYGGVSIIFPAGTLVFQAFENSTSLAASFIGSGDYLVIVSAGNAVVKSVVMDNESLNCHWIERVWEGIDLRECEVGPISGSHAVSVKFRGSYYPRPSVRERRLVYLDSVMDILTSIIATGVSLMYTLVFLPGVYIAMLTSITAALSRALGGSRLRLI